MKIIPVEAFKEHLPDLLRLTQLLVEIESPSTVKTAVDNLALFIIQELEALDGSISVFPQEQTGSSVACKWGNGAGGILLLSHMDTVYPLGTLVERPVIEQDGKLYGPGVLDMKASIAILLTVIRTFTRLNFWPVRPITALFTADEEIGSHTSRALIENEARQADVVLCLEPATINGALKTQRKGTGIIHLLAKGVSAHAGVNHDRGRNAIEELAHHVLAVQQLTDYNKGTTINVGRISGGTRTNVVPEEAQAHVDFRISSMEEFDRLKAWVSSRQPVINGANLTASINLNRPPMLRDEMMQLTFQKARSIGSELNLDLFEGSTGGGSDANFVAPLGIPVLDGLGPIGDGAHSEQEYVVIDSIPERAALLAALLLNW